MLAKSATGLSFKGCKKKVLSKLVCNLCENHSACAAQFEMEILMDYTTKNKAN